MNIEKQHKMLEDYFIKRNWTGMVGSFHIIYTVVTIEDSRLSLCCTYWKDWNDLVYLGNKDEHKLGNHLIDVLRRDLPELKGEKIKLYFLTNDAKFM